VLVAGRAAKPSRTISVGERITLVGPSSHRTVEVLELPRRSMSKADAQHLVRDIGGE